MEVLTTLISNMGFPIACCIAMFYMMNKSNEQHKSEMDKITEALNNNTRAIAELSAKLNGCDS